MSAIPGHKRSFPRDFPMVLFKPDDWRRRRTVERPSEAATGSSCRTSTGFAGAARSSSGSPTSARGRAKPGGTLLTPTPARASCRSPFDPIEGDTGSGEPPNRKCSSRLGLGQEPPGLPISAGFPGRTVAKYIAKICSLTADVCNVESFTNLLRTQDVEKLGVFGEVRPYCIFCSDAPRTPRPALR
jgi:hypothetical protein